MSNGECRPLHPPRILRQTDFDLHGVLTTIQNGVDKRGVAMQGIIDRIREAGREQPVESEHLAVDSRVKPQ